jgi:hypothetical protein
MPSTTTEAQAIRNEATRCEGLISLIEAQPTQPLNNAWDLTASHGIPPVNTLLFSQAEQVRIVTARLRRIATRLQWKALELECAR